MSIRDDLRKGWCPGALRPMETGDGLLLRVKPRAGALSVDALSAIAEVSECFGSGEISLTNRANLQIRGIAREHYDEALDALGQASLLDAHAESEAVRNVVVDPLSGIDMELRDVRCDAAAIEQKLSTNPTLWRLPGKFAISLAGGPNPQPEGRGSDVMAFVDERRAAVALDGDPDGYAFASEAGLVACVERLAYAFLSLHMNDPTVRRMRDAVARCGSISIFAAGGLKRLEREPRQYVERAHRAGIVARGDRIIAVGVGLPFGLISAAGLLALCEVLRSLGVAEVRPGTARVFFFACDSAAARQALDQAAQLGLITRPDDIRLAMDVCPGAPSCRNGTTATLADAGRLAERLRAFSYPASRIHVSGCVKGCARRGPASLTVVARDGRYDIVLDGATDGAVRCRGIAPESLVDVVERILAGGTL